MTPPERFLADPDFTPLSRTELGAGLRKLGVRTGAVLMVHVRLSAFGWVAGGMDTVVHALRHTVGADGTLLAFCGWEDSPYHLSSWPVTWQRAYEEIPVFDPAVSSARRDFGWFPERLRTWPGALRSAHPEVSFAALGPRAAWLLEGQRDQDPWGEDSPLARLVAAGGQVLLLGAPLQRLTLCHHAEALARVAGKRYREYRMPVRTPTGAHWRDYRTLDTFYGVLPYYERTDLNVESPAGTMAEQAVAAGAGRSGPVGIGTGWLFEAAATVRAVTRWLEAQFRSE
jgi:aminoglycoside 3-N-acetyltransferase